MSTTKTTKQQLVTKAEYDRMTPWDQGYTRYEEGELPGSELKDVSNPYPPDTRRHIAWERGSLQAALDEQDSDQCLR